MSRAIGHRLPDRLFALLDGRALHERLGKAFLVTTTDPEGRPHPAMLSYGELLAVDPSRLRLAMYEKSRTVGHLKANGLFTLSLVEPGLAYYIKGKATPLPPMVKYPRLVRFEIMIEEILEDQAEEDEAGARITGGITFEPGPDQSDLLRSWEEMIAALRA